MKQLPRIFFSALTGIILCQCVGGGSDGEKVSPQMTLQERVTSKPDMSKRSQFEKYFTSSNSKNGIGSHYQKQTHHSGSYVGAGGYAGLKEFKTGVSHFGKSKAQGLNMTYALGDKKAAGVSGSFKTDASRLGSKQAREGRSTFSGGDDVFKTRSALPRSQRTGREPLIIENIDAVTTKKSAYSEAEVKRLLGR